MMIAFRYIAFGALMLLSVVLLTTAARLLAAAHRLKARPMTTASVPVPINVADVTEAPERYDVMMSIEQIMYRTVH